MIGFGVITTGSSSLSYVDVGFELDEFEELDELSAGLEFDELEELLDEGCVGFEVDELLDEDCVGFELDEDSLSLGTDCVG